MSNVLIAYFSASGVTSKVANKLGEKLEADVYEIKPLEKYTKADLNYLNKKSRSSIEMRSDIKARPAIVTGDVDISCYDTVVIGFPIWWYIAPRVINTFLESYDFAGKRIIIFATAGSTGKFGNTKSELISSVPFSEIVESKILNGIITESRINSLADDIRNLL